MNENTTYFRLFAHCIPVKGAEESTICDLTRANIKPIPNLLFDILELSENTPVAKIKEHYKHEEDEGIDAYFEMLVKDEWAFYTDEPECFPKLSMEWDWPSTITNAIIEWSKDSPYKLLNVIDQLNELGCHSIEIRNFDHFSMAQIEELMQHISDSRINSVSLILKYHDGLAEEHLSTLLTHDKQYYRLKPVLVHSAPIEKALEHESRMFDKVFWYTKTVLTPTSPDIDDERFFVVNTHAFTEAQEHNMGLNRKVGITSDGKIKNHPNHSKVFGDIKKDTIKDVIKTKDFQKVWALKKDDTAVCKDCEYRYVCTDNTEIIEKDGTLQRIVPCAYDPYTNSWNKDKK